MNAIQYGESTTRETLPDEVLLRVMRRTDAEQNRHVNLARIADSLESLGRVDAWNSIGRSLSRIADALDRAYPPPTLEVTGAEPAAGLLIPAGAAEDSGVDYDDTKPADWGEA